MAAPKLIINNNDPITRKACSLCRTVKPLTSYEKSKTGWLGHNSKCKSCINGSIRARRAAKKSGEPQPPMQKAGPDRRREIARLQVDAGIIASIAEYHPHLKTEAKQAAGIAAMSRLADAAKGTSLAEQVDKLTDEQTVTLVAYAAAVKLRLHPNELLTFLTAA